MNCGRLLFDEQGRVYAYCTQPYGMEHSHDDRTASEAVEQGLAKRVDTWTYPREREE